MLGKTPASLPNLASRFRGPTLQGSDASGVQRRLEIVVARLRDSHIRPIAGRQSLGPPNAHDAVYFRGIAARSGDGGIRVDAVDQNPHLAADLLREPVRADFFAQLHEALATLRLHLGGNRGLR